MSAKFQKGERVWVRDDEGLDVPAKARGKYGIVTGYLHDDGKIVEYWVESSEFPKFNAASYHIVKVSTTMPDEVKADFRAAIAAGDPDLWGTVHIVKNHPDLPEFREINLTTIAFIAMHVGCEVLLAKQYGLRECDIFER